MSSRQPLPTYRTNAGGTIHAETSDPSLLALLREGSHDARNPHPSQLTTEPDTADAPSTSSSFTATSTSVTATTTAKPNGTTDSTGENLNNSALPAFARDHNQSGDFENRPGEIDSGLNKYPNGSSPQATSDFSQRQGNSEANPSAAKGTSSPLTADSEPPAPVARSISDAIIRGEHPSESQKSGERSADRSQAVTPLSRVVPSETDSASSELARLVGTPSRKSFVLSEAGVSEEEEEEEEDDDDDDDEGNGSGVESDEEEREELTPVASPANLDAGGGGGADPRSAEGKHPGQPLAPASPLLPAASAALPAGARPPVASLAQAGGPAVASPDLTNPQHQRFVTPYASRRLKDKPAGRSSAISFALADVEGARTELNVPKESSWSATQAARIRARGEASGGPALHPQPPAPGPAQEADSAEAEGEEAGEGSVTPTPRNNPRSPGNESDLELVDSLDFSADPGQGQGQGQPGALPVSVRKAESPDEDKPTSSSVPPPLDPQRSQTEAAGHDPSSQQQRLEPQARRADVFNRETSYPASSEATPRKSGGEGPSTLSVVGGGGSVASSARVTPVSILKKSRDPVRLPPDPLVDQVYVESPTFTREEEEEYRFVSSRIDNNEDDTESEHATFRALDNQALSGMEGGAAVGIRGNRKPFKQVRYQDDEDRYENREKIVLGKGGRVESVPKARPQKQYVLKSKGDSGRSSSQNQPPQPVRSLTLPSGPTYDPLDEEELKREETYQQSLRDRVKTIQRTAEDTFIPRLPLGRDSVEFVPDSLDVPDDLELDSERHHGNNNPHYHHHHQLYNDAPPDSDRNRLHQGQHRDSLDVYDQQRLTQAMNNTQWSDPPPAPPQGSQGQRPSFAPQRQAYGSVLRQGYAQGGAEEAQGGYERQPYAAAPPRGYADRQAYGEPPGQAYSDAPRQGYAEPPPRGYAERQPYAEPPRQGGYAGPRQGNVDPQKGYGGPPRQGYPDRQGEERQGYAEVPRGYADAPRHGYADPQRQGYANPQRQGYAEPPRAYADPQRQGYAEPPRGYADPQRQGYAEPPRGYVDSDRQGYVDPQRQGYADPQRGYVDPQRQGMERQPYADLQRQGYAEQGFQGQGHFAESGAELRGGFYLTEPGSYSQGGEWGAPSQPGYHGDRGGGDYGHQAYHQGDVMQIPNDNDEDDSDRYQLEGPSQRTTARENSEGFGQTPKPEYDYIAHNKYSYGRTPKRSYKKIHETKKEEEEKLDSIFIKPKVKGKGKASRGTTPHQPQDLDEMDPAAAEELWAQRSASLARAKNSKKQGKKKPSSNTSMANGPNRRLYNSDSSINAAPPRPPLQSIAPGNQMQVVPAGQQLSPSQSPPFRHTIDLKPVSQQVVTEDGQRISVDVNLRLISPPVGAEPEEGYTTQPLRQRLTGQQYPANNQPYEASEENGMALERYSADDVLSSKNIYGGGSATNYASDSNHDYTDAVYSTNPYKKIPPIPSSSEGAPRSAPPAGSEGSYMLTYLREKEKEAKTESRPWYRVYGLKDYKRMQREIRLGTRTLGPDLDNDAYKERREKMQRQLDYAKAVKDKNSKELMSKKPPSFPRPKEEDDMLSKRKLAVEYARNVPKPTVKPKPNPYNSYELASKMSPIAKPSRTPLSAEAQEPSVEVLDLERLHERHENDKRSADMIRQKAQGVLT